MMSAEEARRRESMTAVLLGMGLALVEGNMPPLFATESGVVDGRVAFYVHHEGTDQNIAGPFGTVRECMDFAWQIVAANVYRLSPPESWSQGVDESGHRWRRVTVLGSASFMICEDGIDAGANISFDRAGFLLSILASAIIANAVEKAESERSAT